MTPPPTDGSADRPPDRDPPRAPLGPLGSWRPEDPSEPAAADETAGEPAGAGGPGGGQPGGATPAPVPTGRRDRSARPDRGAVLGSAGVHLVALALAWLSQAAVPSEQAYVTYEVELVSPPARVEGPRTPAPEELRVETPEPDDAAPDEPPPPEEETDPTETRPERDEPRPDARREPETTEEARSPTADPSAATTGEDIRIRMEGLRRDFPRYYENIIQQIQRCFRWRGEGNPRATVRFTIRPDGSVTELRVYRGSGDFGFDLEAMGAVECAGQGRFGPLPADFPWEVLPIEFTFNPGRESDASQP